MHVRYRASQGGRAFKSPRPDQRKQLICLQCRASARLARLWQSVELWGCWRLRAATILTTFALGWTASGDNPRCYSLSPFESGLKTRLETAADQNTLGVSSLERRGFRDAQQIALQVRGKQS